MAAAEEDEAGALARYLQNQGRLTTESASSRDRSAATSTQISARDERESLLKYMAQRGMKILPPAVAHAVRIEHDETVDEEETPVVESRFAFRNLARPRQTTSTLLEEAKEELEEAGRPLQYALGVEKGGALQRDICRDLARFLRDKRPGLRLVARAAQRVRTLEAKLAVEVEEQREAQEAREEEEEANSRTAAEQETSAAGRNGQGGGGGSAGGEDPGSVSGGEEEGGRESAGGGGGSAFLKWIVGVGDGHDRGQGSKTPSSSSVNSGRGSTHGEAERPSDDVGGGDGGGSADLLVETAAGAASPQSVFSSGRRVLSGSTEHQDDTLVLRERGGGTESSEEQGQGRVSDTGGTEAAAEQEENNDVGSSADGDRRSGKFSETTGT